MMLVAIAAAMSIALPQVTPPSTLEQATQAQPPAQAQAQARAYVFARPRPGIHLSPSSGAHYAMAQGCIPHIVTGRPARDFFQTAAFARTTGEGRYAVTSAVTLKEDASGSCVVIVARGDPEGLRQEMLKVFDESGAQRTLWADSGVGSRDSNGNFRHELYCIVLDGRPLLLMMSSSSASDRPKLMASLGNGAEGECARR